jgi:hypothetical protein
MTFTKGHPPYFRPPKGNKWGRKFQIGHPSYLTEESKRKISTNNGRGMLGKHHSEEVKQKMSLAQIKYRDRIGRKKCGGKRKRKCFKCIEWRLKVFERDSYTCQLCNLKGVYLEAHHIKSWIKHPKLRHVLSNGQTLCKKCHKLTENYKSKAKIHE